MEYQEIEEILNRYLEGASTLEEETILKEYFSQADLPAEHLEMKEMFQYFAEANQEDAPHFDISAELNSLVEKEWKKENRSRFSRAVAWVGSAAAVLVLTFGIFQYMNKPDAVIKDTYKDPKLAYAETKRALLLVSRTMNRSTTSLKYLSKVDQSFNHVKKVAEIDQIINSVKN
jgi:chloramphenicol O-acetyltransferase